MMKALLTGIFVVSFLLTGLPMGHSANLTKKIDKLEDKKNRLELEIKKLELEVAEFDVKIDESKAWHKLEMFRKKRANRMDEIEEIQEKIFEIDTQVAELKSIYLKKTVA